MNSEKSLPTKTLGSTGLQVGTVGLGGAFLGVVGNDQAKALYENGRKRPFINEGLAMATIWSAIADGCNLIDTAPAYVDGRSEELIGRALAQRPDLAKRSIVTTKVGDGKNDDRFSHDSVLRSLELSGERLGLQTFQVVYIHDPMNVPKEKILGPGGALEALKELKLQGVVRHIGIAADDPRVNAFYLRTREFEVLLLPTAISLLNRYAFKEIIRLAREFNVGLVAATSLERNLLVRGPLPGVNYLDRNFSPKALETVRGIMDLCITYNISLAAVALQWCTRQDQVATTIPGAASPDEVRQNMAAGKELIPEEFWVKFEDIKIELDPWRDLGISYFKPE